MLNRKGKCRGAEGYVAMLLTDSAMRAKAVTLEICETGQDRWHIRLSKQTISMIARSFRSLKMGEKGACELNHDKDKVYTHMWD